MLVMGKPLVDRRPCPFQMAACECMTWKVHLKSVYMFTLLLAARVRALVSAISSAFLGRISQGERLGFNNFGVRDNCISSYFFFLLM